MEDWLKLTPYELGETKSVEAIPHLIRYLHNGTINEQRLAASAINKLRSRYKKECQAAIPALLDCLRSSAPQVRQYALNALLHLDVSREALPLFQTIAENDPKEYNRQSAMAIISEIEKDNNESSYKVPLSNSHIQGYWHDSERIAVSPTYRQQHQDSRHFPKKQSITQLYAGYVLESSLEVLLRDEKNVENVHNILRSLSYFDVETETDLPPFLNNLDPIVAALHNIVIRGLPTRASIYIEELFASTFQRTEKSIDRIGGIHYGYNNPFPENSLLFNALHVIDPRVDTQYLSDVSIQKTLLESDAEFDFLYKTAQHEVGEFFIQLVKPQRLVTSIVGEHERFTRQRVDFAIEFPYPIAGNKGIVIEIDGEQHQAGINQKQNRLDYERDQAISNAGWAKPLRLQKDRFTQQRLQSVDTKQLLQSEYFKILSDNYTNPLYNTEEGLDILQVVLSPFAIARLQKVLLELILRGVLDLSANSWKIAVIERDVPCAVAAIEDLKQWFACLFTLENRKRILPSIELQIYTSTEFQTAKLHRQLPTWASVFSDVSAFQAASTNIYDVLLDVSMFQRSCLTTKLLDLPCHYEIRLRSTYNQTATRTFITSDLIAYRPVAQKRIDETYEILPEAEEALTYCLQSIFRKNSFRPGQLEILNRALQLQSVIGLLPTGGGKSLTYQLAALLQPGITLVIDPLKSLMKDQVENLRKNGIDACLYINSSLNTEERVFEIGRLRQAEVLFAFVSPERLQITEFRDTLASMEQQHVYFSYCVIDEVHCVSEWGHDFRISYLKLGENAMNFCKTKNIQTIPLFGLTATASFDVLSDVQRELSDKQAHGRLGEDAIIRFETANRAELQFEIVKVTIPQPQGNAGLFDIKAAMGQAKQLKIEELLQELPQAFARYNAEPRYNELRLENLETERFFTDSCEHAGIIFCPHRSWYFGVSDQYKPDTAARKGVYDYLFLLPEEGSSSESKFPEIRAGIFMGSGDEDSANQKIEETSIKAQENFIHNKIHILVATKAFGMGIDKPNIRFTIHVNYPSSLEGFIQEAGRAGRDRKLSLSYLLFNDQEFSTEYGNTDIDKDILLHFYHIAFKGQAKERAILHELLYEITYPPIRQSELIAQQIMNQFGREVRVNRWNDRLYVNDEQRGNYGYLLLPKLSIQTKSSTHHQEISNQILNAIQTYLKEHCPDRQEDIEHWLKTSSITDPMPGIIPRLADIEIGDQISPPIIVQFTNNQKQIVEEASVFFDQLNLYNNTAIAFLDKLQRENEPTISPWLEQMLIKKAQRDNLASEYWLQELKRICYKLRSKADTEKAIFRLFMLGIIDDYTVDYNAHVFELHITKKTDDTYKSYLHTYINTYYSDVRAAQEIQRVDSYQETTILEKCLYFLLDFVYAEVAKKRLEAINAMKTACYEGLKENGNDAFKDFIDIYFHSKYANPMYLPSDTEHGKVFSFDIVWKYIELISEDKTGSQIDNLKHLRGACLRLLTENPDNASFLLLKSFALFILE